MKINRNIATVALALAASMTSAPAFAQATQKFTAAKHNEYGLTYSLPTTMLKAVVTVEHVERKAGPFYKYAKKYLGTTDVITEDSQSWNLLDAKMYTYGVPYTDNQYLMQFKSNASTFIMTTMDGLLLSVNTENVQEPEVLPQSEKADDSLLDNNNYLKQLPGELLASESTSKRAEIAAQMIYRLRESRSSYALGEADQMPPDGEPLRLIMKQIDEQEAALTALFVGTEKRSKEVTTVDYTPGTDDVTDEVILRLSDYEGVVSKDNLSGSPLYLSMKITEKGELPVNEKARRKSCLRAL
jgi:hypothetical protein